MTKAWKPFGGYILWEGVSLLDGVSPIVAIVTEGSSNTKTGDMDQVWILRSDVHPLVAVRDGLDSAICGNCSHRGDRGKGRTCYVTVAFAPAGVYRAYRQGRYDRCDPFERARGRFCRLGAYGDPAAVPADIWACFVDQLAGHTGYTEFWRIRPKLRSICMASVQNEDERRAALALGWRTYRTRFTVGVAEDEIICPASDESGHSTTCRQCRLCGGSRITGAKSIVIFAHGKSPVQFFRNRQQVIDYGSQAHAGEFERDSIDRSRSGAQETRDRVPQIGRRLRVLGREHAGGEQPEECRFDW